MSKTNHKGSNYFTNNALIQAFSWVQTPGVALSDSHCAEMSQYLCGEYSSIVPKILQY